VINFGKVLEVLERIATSLEELVELQKERKETISVHPHPTLYKGVEIGGDNPVNKAGESE